MQGSLWGLLVLMFAGVFQAQPQEFAKVQELDATAPCGQYHYSETSCRTDKHC